jgi:hypothetical protein
MLATRQLLVNHRITVDLLQCADLVARNKALILDFPLNMVRTHHGTEVFKCPHGSSTLASGKKQSPHAEEHCLVHG